MEPALERTASTDAELVQRARGGDRDAYGLLVARHQSLICAVTFGVCGDLARSEDLAQEAFVAGWRALASLRAPERFRSWLAAIARHVAQDDLRRRQRAAPVEALDDLPLLPSPAAVPEQLAMQAEERALLERALAGLPAPYREALVLFHREQQSVAEIALALDTSEDAIKQRLSRGRTMLRERIASWVGDALRRTRPGGAFTVAVVAALPALAAPAAAATISAAAVQGAGGAASSTGSSSAGAASVVAASGAVLGPLLGVLGAVIGVRASLASTRSARERAHVLRQVRIALVESALFVVALGALILFGRSLLPERSWLFAALVTSLVVAHVAVLVVLVVRGNRRQRQIRREDGTADVPRAMQATAPARRRSASTEGLAGGIFGGTAWLALGALLAGDWTMLAVTVLGSAAIFVVASRAARRTPERFDWIVVAALAAVALLALGVVNLRWNDWAATPGVQPHARGWSLAAVDALLVAVFGILLVVFAVRARRADRSRHTRENPPREPQA